MDLYQEITDRIIAQMENGLILWEKPWCSAGRAVSHVTGKLYSLLNQMLLGRTGEYVTFKQCKAEGGKVRKGEKSSMVVFWKWLEQEDEDTGEKKEIPFLRYYNVFHIDQCEGLTAKHTQLPPETTISPDETAERIIADYIHRSGVKLLHQEGDRAFYSPSADVVTLPYMAQFKESAEYYGTAFHELAHSTGHKSRLDRLEKTAFFGRKSAT